MSKMSDKPLPGDGFDFAPPVANKFAHVVATKSKTYSITRLTEREVRIIYSALEKFHYLVDREIQKDGRSPSWLESAEPEDEPEPVGRTEVSLVKFHVERVMKRAANPR